MHHADPAPPLIKQEILDDIFTLETRTWLNLGGFLPWLILFISLILIYHLWKIERDETVQRLQADFDLRARESVERIEQRLSAYEQVLRGVQGLFAASAQKRFMPTPRIMKN